MINKLADWIRQGDRGKPITHAAELARLAGVPLQAAGSKVPVAVVDAALDKHFLSVGDRMAFKVALVQGGMMEKR